MFMCEQTNKILSNTLFYPLLETVNNEVMLVVVRIVYNLVLKTTKH